MGLSFLLVGLILVLASIGFVLKKLTFFEKVPLKDSTGKDIVNPYGEKKFVTKFNFKPLIIVVLLFFASLFQPLEVGLINVGNKGLLINLIGDNRGASDIKEISGFIIYNKYTQEIVEIPLDQRPIEYGKSEVLAKGGFRCTIKPSFNYSVKESSAGDMFTNLRSTYKAGGLEAIQETWLNTAILGSISDVANRYPIEYLFNNKEAYEAEIKSDINKKIGKWFTISQLKTNIIPPDALTQSINDKATADADVIKAEAQAKVATAEAKTIMAIAKGDSAQTVITASAAALAMKLKKEELTPIYIDYLKWIDVDPKTPRVPSTSLGSGSGVLLSR